MMIHEPLPKAPTERQLFFLRKAAQSANRSNMTHRHGCIIVDSHSDEILSTGFNHTYIHMYHKFSCHAECDALRRVKKNFDLSTAEMYVVRLGKGNIEFKLSKPCEGCAKFITKAQIAKVYYSWGCEASST